MKKLVMIMLAISVIAPGASAYVNKNDPRATVWGEFNSKAENCPKLAQHKDRTSLNQNNFGLRINVVNANDPVSILKNTNPNQ